MYWTLELASKLEDAPWPATKEELIDYAIRSGAPLEVLENLQEIEDEGDIYESINSSLVAGHGASSNFDANSKVQYIVFVFYFVN